MPASTKRRSAAGRGSNAAGRGSNARARNAGGRGRGRGRKRTPAERLAGWFGIGGLPSLPVLNQRQRDVLGLALLALGVFLGFVLYGGWNGGSAGKALAVTLGFTVGGARILAPAAAIAAGGVLLCAPLMPPTKPLRTGSLALFSSIMLALAAGTLGISAGQSTRGSHWSATFLEHRGGIFGQAIYEVAHRLVQQVGVDILVVFLSIAGLVLLTGASIATVLRTAGGGLIDTTRTARRRRHAGAATAVAADRGAGGRRLADRAARRRAGCRRAGPARSRAGQAGRARHARRGALAGRDRAGLRPLG
jgi:S-DNA-T family DNA segregation ATPase FtsK/SpoIIIE